jgi:hypothetical protein
MIRGTLGPVRIFKEAINDTRDVRDSARKDLVQKRQDLSISFRLIVWKEIPCFAQVIYLAR